MIYRSSSYAWMNCADGNFMLRLNQINMSQSAHHSKSSMKINSRFLNEFEWMRSRPNGNGGALSLTNPSKTIFIRYVCDLDYDLSVIAIFIRSVWVDRQLAIQKYIHQRRWPAPIYIHLEAMSSNALDVWFYGFQMEIGLSADARASTANECVFVRSTHKNS